MLSIKVKNQRLTLIYHFDKKFNLNLKLYKLKFLSKNLNIEDDQFFSIDHINEILHI